MIEIDGYTDVEPIGNGGLGDVYRATRASTGAMVAIKVLRDVSDESVAWHRTSRELTALVSLAGHAHVIQLFELLDLPEGPALVMEYAPGGSVADLMRRRDDTLTVAESVLVGRHTAAALVAAHARGIVHRDIKPQNLLIDAYGQVKLCDFGIAALTRTDEYRDRTDALSLRYASPEDLDEHDVGPASDVYSLGATLLHIARGAPPTLKERLAPWQPPPTDDVHLAGLDAVIAACLHPEPDERPSAAEVLDELERLGWRIEERQRALVFDPPLDDGVDDDPTDRRPERVVDPVDPGGEVPVGGAVSGAVAPSDVAGRSGDGVPAGRRPGEGVSIAPEWLLDDHREPLDGDATVRRAGRAVPSVGVERPVERVGRGRRRRVLVGGAVVAVAVLAVAVVLRPRSATAPGPNALDVPASSAPAVSAAGDVGPTDGATTVPAPELAVVARPAGLPELTEFTVWPAGSVGECLVQTPDVDVLDTVACDRPHDLQRYVSGTLTGAIADGGFDEVRIHGLIEQLCTEAFEPFVGIDPDASRLHLASTRPTPESWGSGDRAYVCVLGLPGQRLIGDAAGSGF